MVACDCARARPDSPTSTFVKSILVVFKLPPSGILQMSLSRFARRLQIRSVGTPSRIGFDTSLAEPDTHAQTRIRRARTINRERASAHR